MPQMIWSKLNKLQLGRYAEYYAKMEFASYGCYVYTSEVDDHGIDFVVKDHPEGQYYEIQVKSIRKTQEGGYVFIPKDKMKTAPNRLVFLLLFEDGKLPECYIIPSLAWNTPGPLLVSRDYGGEGQTSKPEWGINLSRKNMPLLMKFRAEDFFREGHRS